MLLVTSKPRPRKVSVPLQPRGHDHQRRARAVREHLGHFVDHPTPGPMKRAN